MKERVQILNNIEIAQKIKRIAFQIYESNIDEEEIVLAGIARKGFKFAKRIQEELEKISPFKIVLCEVHVNKKSPRNKVTTSILSEDYSHKSIILIDDVLNSGTTLIYGVRHFLDVPLKQFKTAVLVDRNHKKYPVKADFKGISLSTSLNEMVRVTFEKGDDRAELI
ncbi:phosphoribosyltransferase family protein [Zunongwangia endophytica]|uniref:Phosphoribosyltransferase family protein n=1 Tax=Zunongwangia endophytica TaxID=1808945 RepID=A0ABV8HE14_9FLAO|nr:phosphoribosyltransferase family protein [Zunongwangia endophytica]MDN3596705.1 phosphoribosyltransferase family protein [Zunongwangia endophytica]